MHKLTNHKAVVHKSYSPVDLRTQSSGAKHSVRDMQNGLQPRPQTRSLTRSTLAEKGYTLPKVKDERATKLVTCGNCGEVLTCNKFATHRRTCKPQIPSLAIASALPKPKGDKKPSRDEVCTAGLDKQTPDKGPPTVVCKICGRNYGTKSISIHEPQCIKKYENEKKQHTLDTRKPVARRPPTVLCYICGREYGTKSISIHEPQCLKKFEAYNETLPLNERRPLPQKPVPLNPVSSQTMKEGTISSLPPGVYHTATLQETSEQYFQYCYREFERNLIPCSTCGRTFAPERHAKHAYRCKAKPLDQSLKKKK